MSSMEPELVTTTSHLSNKGSVADSRQHDAARVEDLISDRLMKGYSLLNSACPSCSTPLIKNDRGIDAPGAAGVNLAGAKFPIVVSSDSFDQPFIPVIGVPFCVSCQSHVVTQESDVDALESSESFKEKGSILVAFQQDDASREGAASTGSNESSQPQSSSPTSPYLDDAVLAVDDLGNNMTLKNVMKESESLLGKRLPAVDPNRFSTALFCGTTASRQMVSSSPTNENHSNEGGSMVEDSHESSNHNTATASPHQHQYYEEEQAVLNDPYNHNDTDNHDVAASYEENPAFADTLEELEDEEEVPAHKQSAYDRAMDLIAMEKQKMTTEITYPVETLAEAPPPPRPTLGSQPSPMDLYSSMVLQGVSSLEKEEDPETMMIEYSVRREIATRVLGAKLLDGYTLRDSQCDNCGMPVMEKDCMLECVVCPVLLDKVLASSGGDQQQAAQQRWLREKKSHEARARLEAAKLKELERQKAAAAEARMLKEARLAADAAQARMEALENAMSSDSEKKQKEEEERARREAIEAADRQLDMAHRHLNGLSMSEDLAEMEQDQARLNVIAAADEQLAVVQRHLSKSRSSERASEASDVVGMMSEEQEEVQEDFQEEAPEELQEEVEHYDEQEEVEHYDEQEEVELHEQEEVELQDKYVEQEFEATNSHLEVIQGRMQEMMVGEEPAPSRSRSAESEGAEEGSDEGSDEEVCRLEATNSRLEAMQARLEAMAAADHHAQMRALAKEEERLQREAIEAAEDKERREIAEAAAKQEKLRAMVAAKEEELLRCMAEANVRAQTEAMNAQQKETDRLQAIADAEREQLLLEQLAAAEEEARLEAIAAAEKRQVLLDAIATGEEQVILEAMAEAEFHVEYEEKRLSSMTALVMDAQLDEQKAMEEEEEQATQERAMEFEQPTEEEQPMEELATEEQEQPTEEEVKLQEQAQLAEAMLQEEAKVAEAMRLQEAKIAEGLLLEEARRYADAKLMEEVRAAEEAVRAKEEKLAEQARLEYEAMAAEQARLAEEERMMVAERLAAETRRLELLEEQKLVEEAKNNELKFQEGQPLREASAMEAERQLQFEVTVQEAERLAEIEDAEQARKQEEQEMQNGIAQKQAVEEATLLARLECAAEEKQQAADEAISKAQEALTEVSELKKETLAKAIAQAEIEAIAEAEAFAEKENQMLRSLVIEKTAKDLEEERWETLRAEGRSILTRRMIQGWKLNDDLCHGVNCRQSPLVEKRGKVECVVCGGNGSGTDGVYAPDSDDEDDDDLQVVADEVVAVTTDRDIEVSAPADELVAVTNDRDIEVSAPSDELVAVTTDKDIEVSAQAPADEVVAVTTDRDVEVSAAEETDFTVKEEVVEAKEEVIELKEEVEAASSELDRVVCEVQDSPSASRQGVERFTSHQGIERSASHQGFERSVSHLGIERSVSHLGVERSASHQGVEPSASHQSVARSASHQSVEPSASHQSVEPSVSHQSVEEIKKVLSEPKADFEVKRNLVSNEIGKRMIDGWILLDLSCPTCVMPLMTDGHGGPECCVLCGPVNLDKQEGPTQEDQTDVAASVASSPHKDDPPASATSVQSLYSPKTDPPEETFFGKDYASPKNAPVMIDESDHDAIETSFHGVVDIDVMDLPDGVDVDDDLMSVIEAAAEEDEKEAAAEGENITGEAVAVTPDDLGLELPDGIEVDDDLMSVAMAAAEDERNDDAPAKNQDNLGSLEANEPLNKTVEVSSGHAADDVSMMTGATGVPTDKSPWNSTPPPRPRSGRSSPAPNLPPRHSQRSPSPMVRHAAKKMTAQSPRRRGPPRPEEGGGHIKPTARGTMQSMSPARSAKKQNAGALFDFLERDDDVSIMSAGSVHSRAETVATNALDVILTRIDGCKGELTGEVGDNVEKQLEMANLIEKLAAAAVAVRKLEDFGL